VRALNSIEQTVFEKLGYNAHVRVRIADADDVLRDYANLPVGSNLNWVVSVEWSEHMDQPTAVAEVVLTRAHWNLSIAPLQDSRLNRTAAGAFGRILDIGRRIFLDAAVSASDGGPARWVTIFEGHVLEVDWGAADDNEVKVTARDLGGKVLDRFIEVDKRIYSTAAGIQVDLVMLQILIDNMTAPDVVPFFFDEAVPGWVIRQFVQDRMSTLEAIRRLAAQIGFDVRYRWSEGFGVIGLALWLPPRTPAVTPNKVWRRDAYFSVSQQRYSLEDLRNRIQVAFTEKTGLRRRLTVLAQDVTSQNLYGVRFMEVGEAATSGIDTAVEAQRMADAIRDDLSQPRSYVSLVTPMFYPAMLGDTIEIEKDGVTFDQAIKIVAYGIKHRVSGKQHSTEWTGRQSGGGYRDRWMESEVRPGIGPKQDTTLDTFLVRATRSVVQVIPGPNVPTVIVFDNEQLDSGAQYNPATGVFTVNAAGVYEVSADLQFQTGLPNVTVSLFLYRNGAQIAVGEVQAVPAAGNAWLHLKHTNQQLVVGDLLTVVVNHSAGAGVNQVVGGTDTVLALKRLRAGG